MPSIASTIYRPYEANVLMVPSTLSAITDMWGGRQESDILLEDNVKKTFLSQLVESEPFVEAEPTSDLHTIRIQVRNPYSLTEPIRNIFMCECDECRSSMMMPAQASSEQEAEVIMFETEMVEEPISQFMPPPPPRVDTYDVIAACGCEDPDSAVYNMMVRWYTRTSRVAAFFTPDETCPPPNPELYTFAQWCERVNEWWYRNFEHRQMKPVAPARSRNAPTGTQPLW
eukprot:CAMPEP_0176417404 /NCGR_PEP_ID=MMETSP0127-20121128/6871_1 /TAXON_ID=938130 /ORGANISM="Platyophrya macrostoma, Strain WH" /LENGTH=227 /DNA_ID=CAMNT_0017797563 /DNA_START=77 /DNA_END=760 /DNA_ORIENTATION=+